MRGRGETWEWRDGERGGGVRIRAVSWCLTNTSLCCYLYIMYDACVSVIVAVLMYFIPKVPMAIF